MKNVLRTTVSVLLLVTLLFCVGCGDDDTPTGFLLASDKEADGFALYVPEDWSFYRADGVVTAYLSKLSTANITAAWLTSDADTVVSYFNSCLDDFKKTFTDFRVMDGYPVESELGGKPAYHYTYTGSSLGKDYRVEQYIALMGQIPSDGLFCLTYTAATSKNEITGTVDYDETSKYLEKIVSEFRFTGSAGKREDLADTEAEAPEGMKRASRFAYLGAEFFVPNDYTVTMSEGFVGAVSPAGMSLGFQRILYTTAADDASAWGLELVNPDNGFTLEDYWNLLKKQYGAYFDDLRVTGEPVLRAPEGGEADQPKEAGGSKYYRFDLAGKRAGEEYEVAVFLLRKTEANRFSETPFFLLSATAKKGGLAAHEDDLARILREVKHS